MLISKELIEVWWSVWWSGWIVWKEGITIGPSGMAYVHQQTGRRRKTACEMARLHRWADIMDTELEDWDWSMMASGTEDTEGGSSTGGGNVATLSPMHLGNTRMRELPVISLITTLTHYLLSLAVWRLWRRCHPITCDGSTGLDHIWGRVFVNVVTLKYMVW